MAEASGDERRELGTSSECPGKAVLCLCSVGKGRGMVCIIFCVGKSISRCCCPHSATPKDVQGTSKMLLLSREWSAG